MKSNKILIFFLTIFLSFSFQSKALLIFGDGGYEELITIFKSLKADADRQEHEGKTDLAAQTLTNARDTLTALGYNARDDIKNNILLRAYLAANGLFPKESINQQDLNIVDNQFIDSINKIYSPLCDRIGRLKALNPAPFDQFKLITDLFAELALANQDFFNARNRGDADAARQNIDHASDTVNRIVMFSLPNLNNENLRKILSSKGFYPEDKITERDLSLIEGYFFTEIARYRKELTEMRPIAPTAPVAPAPKGFVPTTITSPMPPTEDFNMHLFNSYMDTFNNGGRIFEALALDPATKRFYPTLSSDSKRTILDAVERSLAALNNMTEQLNNSPSINAALRRELIKNNLLAPSLDHERDVTALKANINIRVSEIIASVLARIEEIRTLPEIVPMPALAPVPTTPAPAPKGPAAGPVAKGAAPIALGSLLRPAGISLRNDYGQSYPTKESKLQRLEQMKNSDTFARSEKLFEEQKRTLHEEYLPTIINFVTASVNDVLNNEIFNIIANLYNNINVAPNRSKAQKAYIDFNSEYQLFKRNNNL